MTKLKNKNTDTINRAIHSAMGGHVHDDHPDTCFSCGMHREMREPYPNFTIPGQPLEDAKAWCVNQFGLEKFGIAVNRTIDSDYEIAEAVGVAATLPAIDMVNIIVGLIDEGKINE